MGTQGWREGRRHAGCRGLQAAALTPDHGIGCTSEEDMMKASYRTGKHRGPKQQEGENPVSRPDHIPAQVVCTGCPSPGTFSLRSSFPQKIPVRTLLSDPSSGGPSTHPLWPQPNWLPGSPSYSICHLALYKLPWLLIICSRCHLARDCNCPFTTCPLRDTGHITVPKTFNFQVD